MFVTWLMLGTLTCHFMLQLFVILNQRKVPTVRFLLGALVFLFCLFIIYLPLQPDSVERFEQINYYTVGRFIHFNTRIPCSPNLLIYNTFRCRKSYELILVHILVVQITFKQNSDILVIQRYHK